MAKLTKPTTRIEYREAIDVKEYDIAFDQHVYGRKVFRKRNESFRRVRLTLADGSVREFRERFRVPVTVQA
jgi:hypothetical protein